MPSTVIASYSYNETEQALTIRFVSGSCYVYQQVPPQVFEAFRQYREKGVFYNQQIKNKYTYIKIKRPDSPNAPIPPSSY
ncbi:KTSC domain-containing protein [uncultured Chitinophaga sp.]|uniref:KTSC domain-containing protein n=1 Tax=uncultured Chitinophaga sp. TaxID=339340 RepID=UPI00345C34F8